MDEIEDNEAEPMQHVGVGLTSAIETLADAYRRELYQEEWPEADRKAQTCRIRKVDPFSR